MAVGEPENISLGEPENTSIGKWRTSPCSLSFPCSPNLLLVHNLYSTDATETILRLWAFYGARNWRVENYVLTRLRRSPANKCSNRKLRAWVMSLSREGQQEVGGNRGRGTRTYGSDGSNHKFGTPLQSENNVASEVLISGLLFGVNKIRKHG